MNGPRSAVVACVVSSRVAFARTHESTVIGTIICTAGYDYS